MPADQPYKEHELLLRIAKDDEDAFAALIDFYSSRIYAHALAYLKQPEIAEEIAQDVMLMVWNRRAELPALGNFPGWLYVITRNRTYSAFRQMLDHDTLPDADELDRQLQSPQATLEYKQLSETLQRGIDRLPPRRKEVFRLSRMEGLSYEEIATQLGISKSAVNQHIVEALAFLRNWLQQELGTLFWLAVFMIPYSLL